MPIVKALLLLINYKRITSIQRHGFYLKSNQRFHETKNKDFTLVKKITLEKHTTLEMAIKQGLENQHERKTQGKVLRKAFRIKLSEQWQILN